MLRQGGNGYKSLEKKERFKIMKKAFPKDHFKHTPGILKNAHGHLVWKKFVLFSFFFLIYTKHSLKKPEEGGGECLLPISSSVAEWKIDRKLTQW